MTRSRFTARHLTPSGVSHRRWTQDRWSRSLPKIEHSTAVDSVRVEPVHAASLRDIIAIVAFQAQRARDVTWGIPVELSPSSRSRSRHADQSGAHGRSHTHDAFAGPFRVAHGTIHRWSIAGRGRRAFPTFSPGATATPFWRTDPRAGMPEGARRKGWSSEYTAGISAAAIEAERDSTRRDIRRTGERAAFQRGCSHREREPTIGWNEMSEKGVKRERERERACMYVCV